MITTSEFKRGLRILIDGDPYTILETMVQTPSARGASSLAKIKCRNLRTGQVFDKTIRTGEKFEEPDLERRPLQYLYSDGESRVFLDMESYEQVGARVRTSIRVSGPRCEYGTRPRGGQARELRQNKSIRTGIVASKRKSI
jgi:translation elongation factor P/translation initiation factor 5A